MLIDSSARSFLAEVRIRSLMKSLAVRPVSVFTCSPEHFYLTDGKMQGLIGSVVENS